MSLFNVVYSGYVELNGIKTGYQNCYFFKNYVRIWCTMYRAAICARKSLLLSQRNFFNHLSQHSPNVQRTTYLFSQRSTFKYNFAYSSTPSDKTSTTTVTQSTTTTETKATSKDVIKEPFVTRTIQWVKEGIHHYWTGTKLFVAETRTAISILRSLTRGNKLTRRERVQLLRSAADMFKLVPFMVFVIVPFLEFLLPLALKLFPNMLPSTFEDKLKKVKLKKLLFCL